MLQRISITAIFCLFLGLNTVYTQINFPQDWLGNYAGIMYAYYPGSERVDKIQVFFELHDTKDADNWIYRLSYSNEKFGDIVKDYLLTKPTGEANYMYHLDEKDGIVIEQPLIDDTFYSSFTVANTWISSRMRRVEGGIEFEVVSANQKASLSTKKEADKPEDVFIVDSYPPFTIQRVFLEEVD